MKATQLYEYDDHVEPRQAGSATIEIANTTLRNIPVYRFIDGSLDVPFRVLDFTPAKK
jgi:hypothetical protein